MTHSKHRERVILLNKPFHVLTQFTDSEGRDTLANYLAIPNIYAAGRLDYNSEGLLVLTNSGALQAKISDPRYTLEKTYWVQVEGMPTQEQIAALSRGIELSDGLTRPAHVQLLHTPSVWERNPPIRFRKRIPDSWMEVTITEGRNRQVRRMTAAVGLPALRLIRMRVGPWSIDDLLPGAWREADPNDLSFLHR